MTTALHAAALIDPAQGDVVRGGVTVLLENESIAAWGPRRELHTPRDAEVIDAADLTVLPGLIDCHVHLCLSGQTFDLAERLMTPAALSLLGAIPACRATLAAGFTTVRDAGGTPNAVRLAVERGYFPGPRMVLAVQMLSQTGGHADPRYPCGVNLPLTSTLDLPGSVVDGVDEMRRRVRELIRAGADWIKLCTSGGVLSPGDSPSHATFSVDEIRTAVAEAAAQGRFVMAHAQATAGISNALAGGAKTIEHGIWLDNETVGEMVDGHHWLVPTLIAPLWVIRHSEAGRMPAYAAEKARRVAEDHARSIQLAIEAGVSLAFGTDTGVGPHGSNNEEFRLLNELGMDRLDCIRSATTAAAELLGFKGKIGCLDTGAAGDLIGVAGDPLDDIGSIADASNVKLVVKAGGLVKNEFAHRPTIE